MSFLVIKRDVVCVDTKWWLEIEPFFLFFRLITADLFAQSQREDKVGRTIHFFLMQTCEGDKSPQVGGGGASSMSITGRI